MPRFVDDIAADEEEEDMMAKKERVVKRVCEVFADTFFKTMSNDLGL